MVSFTPIDQTDLRPIRDIVYETLRSAIMGGQLASGDRLVENQLAQQMGVSRTPVRESLRMLEQDGLAIAVPRRGTVVAVLRKEDAIEIYRIRAVLEGLAVRMAAENITPDEVKLLREKLKKMRPEPDNLAGVLGSLAEFNTIIAVASRSQRIAQLIEIFSGQLRGLRGVSLVTMERQQQAWEEHTAIVDALEVGDGDLAERLAREHVERAKQAFLAQFR